MSLVAAGSGWVACFVAALLGAPWPGVIVAAVLYGGAWLRGMPRVLALLAAATWLGVVSPVAGPWAALWLVPGLLAVAPLWAVLGGGVPWQGMAVLAGAVALAFLAIAATPWRVSMFDADISARAQVMLLAIVVLLAQFWRSKRDGASTLRRSAR